MSIKKLTKMFQHTCKEVVNISLSETYKTSYLKSSRQASYPDMVFSKQRDRKKSQVAFFFSTAGGYIVVTRDELDGKEALGANPRRHSTGRDGDRFTQDEWKQRTIPFFFSFYFKFINI